jgi:5-methylcytosine-specific restriction endonuclease McrA
MANRLRYAPCPVPGCPEMAEACTRHAKVPWQGRNGSTRRQAMGISDTEWGKVVRAAMRRDHYRCLRCGGEATHVDHLVPIAWRRPPATHVAHLARVGCLCSDCHDVKTKAESRIGRQGRPTDVLIASHVRWWLGQLQGGTRAH